MSTPARVLVVDDDVTVSDVVARYLEREGYEVDCVADGIDALAHAIGSPPDLVVLDLMLPRLDGLELCRRLRATTAVPIIMLTARGDESDRVMGLELGADDYLSKPFSPRELMARVKSVLRRATGPLAAPIASTVLESGDLRVDPASRQAFKCDEIVALTAREFDLLCFLMRAAPSAFTRNELLEHVWGYTYGDTSTVTVHVRRLREKIEIDPSAPDHIQTVWGVGYRFAR
ncbi:MAG: response regulator transcription factor [Actinobacteria bacterium]|nr:response regulator transcription factor [Actinomycetota bacterium]